MSQSVSELSRRLENALDTSYNITDLPTVVEIIGVLESTRITIEQLESTQLTKCINHMRRRTADETLARRSKNLIKRWRSMLPQVLPPSPNGKTAKWRRNGEQSSKKRRGDTSASPVPPPPPGGDGATATTTTEMSPKRRGRKRGSRGVDALMGDVVETSPYLEFKHKVASGPKKVKTTKELLEDLQNRKLNSSSSVTASPIVSVRPPSPLSVLHSDGSQSHEASVDATTAVVEPAVTATATRVPDIEEEICELKRQLALVAAVQQARGEGVGHEEEEEEEEPQCTCTFTEIHETDENEENGVVTKMKRPRSPLLGDGLNAAVTDGEASIGGRRPPVRSIFDLDETDDQARIEIEESVVTEGPTQWRCVEDPDCPAAHRECSDVTLEDVRALHSLPLDNINGNWCAEVPPEAPPPEEPPEGGLWERVVPQFGRDAIPKCHEEGVRWRRKRRRTSCQGEEEEETEEGVFREWFQTLHVKSYNDELLTILPYVVID